MSTRIKQVQSILTRALSQVLSQQMSDPRIAGLVSVTHVDVSPDLANATVGVSVMPKRRSGVALHALNHGAKRIQRLVRNQVSLRRVPQFKFELDQTIERHAAVLRDIEEGMRRERERHQSDADAPTPADSDLAPSGLQGETESETASTCPEDQSL